MLTANAALAKLANYKKTMERQSRQVKGRMAALRATVYDSAVIIYDQTHNNTKEFIAKIKAAFPGRADCVDAFLEDTFRIYCEFDGDYRTAVRSVEMGATKKEFIAAPFTAAFKNPLPKRKPDGRTAKARLDILDDAEAPARTRRHVEFDADEEPRVTPAKVDTSYQRIKELEQELAIKDKLIAALQAENTALKAKLKGRAA